jgi:hypothetical protein
MSLLEGSKGPAAAPDFFSWLLRVGLVSALPPGLVSPSAKVTFRSRLGDLTFGEITGCSPGVPMASRFCPLEGRVASELHGRVPARVEKQIAGGAADALSEEACSQAFYVVNVIRRAGLRGYKLSVLRASPDLTKKNSTLELQRPKLALFVTLLVLCFCSSTHGTLNCPSSFCSLMESCAKTSDNPCELLIGENGLDLDWDGLPASDSTSGQFSRSSWRSLCCLAPQCALNIEK